MDRFSAIRTFAAVLETGSFSKAARRMGISNATVTETIKGLEKHLGVQLINRNTRSICATDEGTCYYQRTLPLLAEVDEIEATLSKSQSVPSGKLSVEIPAALGHAYIVPALNRFSKAYPQITTFVLLDSGPIGVAEGGVDVSLQLGDLKDSSAITKKICDTQYVACAAPGYLARCGEPNSPTDLNRFNCLGFYVPRAGRLMDWQFRRGSAAEHYCPIGTMHFNSSEALVTAALAGEGIINTVDLLVGHHLDSGALRCVLADWTTQRRALSLVYPQKRYISAKVRVFIQFIEEIFTATPAAAVVSPNGAQ